MIPNHNYKVVWIYNGQTIHVDDMYDKPRPLCVWWIRQHIKDAQYSGGIFKVVSMMSDKTS